MKKEREVTKEQLVRMYEAIALVLKETCRAEKIFWCRKRLEELEKQILS